MKKQISFGNTRHSDIPLESLAPSDFSDKHYEGRILMRAQDGSLVIVMSSKSAEPVRWRICNGTSNSYFLSHREVMDYCAAKGYKFIKGEPQK